MGLVARLLRMEALVVRAAVGALLALAGRGTPRRLRHLRGQMVAIL